ncbi:MAG TPA: alpha/beta hydrolase [Dehalococcoidia bacterium]|nr:alpha/beta hydrolase [Dehalococcoidia bacterium]
MASPQTGIRDIYVDANGIRHHLIVRGQPGTPIVFMIHGLTGHAHSYDATATSLAANYHVYCLDVRGRGESGWGKPSDYHAGTYVEDLEQIRKALGIERFTLVGTWMGGLIALRYVPDHQQNVVGIVLNDIGPEVDAAGASRIRSFIADAPRMFPDPKAVVHFYQEKWAPLISGLPDDRLEEFARHHVRKDDNGVWVWKMDPAIRTLDQPAPPLDTWTNFDSITSPILAIRRSESDVLTTPIAKRMTELNERCKIIEVPGGPAPFLTEPTAWSALQEFLAGLQLAA